MKKLISICLVILVSMLFIASPAHAVLNKVDTGNPIRGIIIPTAAQRRDCQAVIAQLTFSDMTRGAGTLHTVGVARLDNQGRTGAGDTNLQVQIGTKTAAAALIAASALQTTDPANQRGVANAGISVLNQSLDSGTIWSVTGSLP